MNYKIAIITSRFNQTITELLLQGAKERFDELKVSIDEQDIFSVPGALEIPVVAAILAAERNYHAIVCLGCVIRGETNHYDYVCSQVSYGCQKIAIEAKLPIIFGILTTDNEEQALARCGGPHGHKGKECADSAVQMVQLLQIVAARQWP